MLKSVKTYDTRKHESAISRDQRKLTAAREKFRRFAAFIAKHDPEILASVVDADRITSTLDSCAAFERFLREYVAALVSRQANDDPGHFGTPTQV
jgi:hypothetical protein